MLKRLLFRPLFFLALITLFALAACQKDGPTEPDPPTNEWLEPTASVNGTLTELQSIPLLTLWGTQYEQGFAHGYLLAPELIEYLEMELNQNPGLIDFVENTMLPNLHIYTVPDEYLREIEGFMAGMEARAGDSIYVAGLDRYITVNDMIASTCIDNVQHLLGTNCTSFSAWDTATANGGIITGRNYDQPDDMSHTGRYMLIVRKSPPGSDVLPWVSVNLPGALSCETGMNSEGVTFATQEVNQILPTSASGGFCPEHLLQRKLLESAHAASVVADVSGVLDELYTNGGEAILMSWPSGYHDTCSVVFEIDGDLDTGHGYNVRYPNNGSPFIIQTNQFYQRMPFSHSDRYVLLNSRMVRILQGRSEPLSVDYAWELLSEVPQVALLIQVAVVFEPDRMLMHVGFAEPGTHATSGTRITIDVAALLN
jgi:hypothetical protein